MPAIPDDDRDHFFVRFMLLEPRSLHLLGPLEHRRSLQRWKHLIVREKDIATDRLKDDLAESGPGTAIHLLPSIIQLTAFDPVGSVRPHDHMLHYLVRIWKLLDVMVEQIACEGRDDHPQRIVSGS